MDFRKLAELYGFKYFRVENNDGIAVGIDATLATPGAAICEVNISPDQTVTPKASAFRRADGSFESRPLEDMSPFLPREEVYWNMHLFDEGASGEVEEFQPTEAQG
jgi:acetolactate synthase-1/2/3 large subunit